MAQSNNAPTAESGQEPAADNFAKLKAWVKDSMEKHADFYKEAEECFGFVAGRSLKGDGQWPGTSWQEMLDSGRQPIEFNRIGPIVDSVCGLEVNNRQAIKFLPRTEGDSEVDERLSSLADWARDETDAEDEESEMFRNAVICGRGFTETRIDFDVETTGKIIVENLDPLECGVDPASRKACFSDARYLWRYKDLPTDEAKAMFPGVDVTALHASWAMQITPQDGGEGNKTDYPDEQRPGFAKDLPPKTVRLVQIQWWERENRYLVASPTDETPQDIPAGEWEGKSEEDKAGLTAQKVERRKYFQAILGRFATLEEVEKKGFTIRACTGRWDRNKAYHYGVVRPCRDPQMLANKTLSQVLHIINTNAKGGIIYEEGAFANPRDAEKDWSNPAKSVKVKQGAIEKIRPREAPAINPALATLQEFSISSIRDVTGVSVEMLGLADRDQPASLEYQRRQSAMTILASLFNALRHYRKLQGRTLIEQLKLLPPGVLIRVLIDPQQAMGQYVQQLGQWHQAVGLPFRPPMQAPTLDQGVKMFEAVMRVFPQIQQHMAQMAQAQGQQPPQIPPPPEPPTSDFMKQTKMGEVFDPNRFGLGEDAEFDVIVDEMPSSPNQKEATWATIQPFIAEMPLPLLPAVLKYSPLPESAVEELSEAIKSMGGGGDPQAAQQAQQQAQQAGETIQQLNQQLTQLKLKNQQLQDRSTLDSAKAQAAITDSETRRITAISDHALGTGDQQLQEMKQRLDLLTTAVGHIVELHKQSNQIGADQAAQDLAAQQSSSGEV